MQKILIFSLLVIFPCISKSETLDELGLKYGTDKSSSFHTYTKIYEKYFCPLREKPIKFLEIGFAQGASAHMWEDYFANGQLFFIDIDPTVKKYLHNFKKIRLHFANQENPGDLIQFIKEVGSNFDIIIDDGGHSMNQQITSFKTLFPHLKSGGIYVIEDLHTSYPYMPGYAKEYGCGNRTEQTAVEFLQSLIHSINFPGAHTGCADFKKCPNSILEELSTCARDIESMHFYCSLCFIFKK